MQRLQESESNWAEPWHDVQSDIMRYAAHEIVCKRLELLRAFSWMVSWLGLQLQEAVNQLID